MMMPISNLEKIMNLYGHKRHELFYSSGGGLTQEMCCGCGLIISEENWEDSYSIKIGDVDVKTLNKQKLYCKKISSML